MSSWVALRRRISFSPGQRVLILGHAPPARIGQDEVHQLAAGGPFGAIDARLPSLSPSRIWSLTVLRANAPN